MGNNWYYAKQSTFWCKNLRQISLIYRQGIVLRCFRCRFFCLFCAPTPAEPLAIENICGAGRLPRPPGCARLRLHTRHFMTSWRLFRRPCSVFAQALEGGMYVSTGVCPCSNWPLYGSTSSPTSGHLPVSGRWILSKINILQHCCASASLLPARYRKLDKNGYKTGHIARPT